MVYFLTSRNVKLLTHIFEDYAAAPQLSPYEYIKIYMDNCPEGVEPSKLIWIKESFLGVLKHEPLLQDIAAHMFEEISDEDQQNFMIIFHALIFQIEPKDMQNLYKCLFNLSKSLLDTLTNLLSNNEILTYISQIAHKYYDTAYITEKIINPLFSWQPYISEIAHEYAEYLHKLELRKVKPSTVPIQPNVLMHITQSKKYSNMQNTSSPMLLPLTPPNSENLTKPRQMLTKSAIDKKLEKLHEKNKKKATKLLNAVKNTQLSYDHSKSDKFYKKISEMKNIMEDTYTAPKYKAPKLMNVHSIPIKNNAATIKRLNNRMQVIEEQEILWLQNVLTNCSNCLKIDELEKCEREEKEKERLMDIERKHLLGQISHEEAVIAKKKVCDNNKKKYLEFLKEKALWNEQIDNWKKKQVENNRKQVERLSLAELSLHDAKAEYANRKKEQADKIKKDRQALQEEALKVKQKELKRKINMIKEIKILAMIAKKAKVPKVIDLTETSGFGFLCEMSIAELQERLSKMKMELNDELENKRKQIKEKNENAKQELQEVKNNIENYMKERAEMRKNNKKQINEIDTKTSKEINDLKKALQEKRNLRVKLQAL